MCLLTYVAACFVFGLLVDAWLVLCRCCVLFVVLFCFVLCLCALVVCMFEVRVLLLWIGFVLIYSVFVMRVFVCGHCLFCCVCVCLFASYLTVFLLLSCCRCCLCLWF